MTSQIGNRSSGMKTRAPQVTPLKALKSTPSELPRNTAPAAPQKTVMFVVYGYFCDWFKNAQHRRLQDLQLAKHYHIDTVKTFCNEKDPKSMTKNIYKSIFNKQGVLQPTAFVEKILKEVCAAMSQGKRVILVGHSYGGSVVTRVALHLKKLCTTVANKEKLKNLKVITFGSILAPNLNNLKNIDITHYIYGRNIARLCHNKSYKCKKLKARKLHGPIGSHLNYDTLILELASAPQNWAPSYGYSF